MRRLRVTVLDLVTKGPTRRLYSRVMNPNLASIMPQVVATFDEARRAAAAKATAENEPDFVERMQPFMPDLPCNGYWFGRPGLEQGMQGAAGGAAAQPSMHP